MDIQQRTSQLACLTSALKAAHVGLVERDVSLARCSWYDIGGPADIMVHPASLDGLQRALSLINTHDIPVFIMGDGSNVIFDDAGFRGVILRLGKALSGLDVQGTQVTAQAGIWVPRLALELARRGLTGLEHIVGIPGRLGGLVVMNGGSQRRGIGSHIVKVCCADETGALIEYTREACAFAYRRSALQRPDRVVLSVTLQLEKAPSAQVRREMIEILASRRKKFPKQYPNCGSVFLSDPVMYDIIGPPGKAVEDAGLRGRVIGGAQISPIHGNFIINKGGATARNVLQLIYDMRHGVGEKTGYWMDCEARFVHQSGHVVPAHQAAEVLFGGHLASTVPGDLRALL